jgi:hypothetical protein
MPRAPIKLFYCHGDEQVTYLNSERAYDSWTARGATKVEKQDLGNFTHGDCIQYAVLAATSYLLSLKEVCTGIEEKDQRFNLKIYPNPADDVLVAALPHAGFELSIFDVTGRLMKKSSLNNSLETVNIIELKPGIYIAAAQDETGQVLRTKFSVK